MINLHNKLIGDVPMVYAKGGGKGAAPAPAPAPAPTPAISAEAVSDMSANPISYDENNKGMVRRTNKQRLSLPMFDTSDTGIK